MLLFLVGRIQRKDPPEKSEVTRLAGDEGSAKGAGSVESGEVYSQSNRSGQSGKSAAKRGEAFYVLVSDVGLCWARL